MNILRTFKRRFGGTLSGNFAKYRKNDRKTSKINIIRSTADNSNKHGVIDSLRDVGKDTI